MLNNNPTIQVILYTNGFFYSRFESSYFCGRYRGDPPARPIEVDLPVSDFDFFVSFSDGLWVNHTRYPYRYSALPEPPLPLYIGSSSHLRLGEFESLDYLIVEEGFYTLNGTRDALRDFPIHRFQMSRDEIRRANRFIALGFNRLGLVYAWYKPVCFLSLAKPWNTLYLRIHNNLGIER